MTQATRRRSSPTVNAWPSLHPPQLARLPLPPPRQDPNTLPPSSRHRGNQLPTHQDEIDQLDWEEETWFQTLHDTRGHGFAFLVPLGRQSTQEEDAESAFSPSPRAVSATPVPIVVDAAAVVEMDAAPDLDAEIEDADGSSEEEDEDEGSEDEDEDEGSGSEDEEDEDEEGSESEASGETRGTAADAARMQVG